MSRILGIDLGERRIGLAVADAGIGIARPLATIGRGRDIASDTAALGRVCREQDVAELVVGLPLEAGGGEGPMAHGARAWAVAVAARLELPVSLRDERLSSFTAEERLGRMPRGRSGGPPTRSQRNAFRARIDREAATVILQDELDARQPAGVARLAPGGASERRPTTERPRAEHAAEGRPASGVGHASATTERLRAEPATERPRAESATERR
jgi:putative pre-16S rRNA nuclease